MENDSDMYTCVHQILSLDTATEDDLQKIIRTFPVIDNHAHNLLPEELAYGNQEYPFECITSEAQGHALLDHTHRGLAHIRGINQLAELFKCPPTLNDVKAARYEWIRRDYQALIKRCFEGTHAIMMDDGFSSGAVHPVAWHRQFTPTVSRIVRIEAIAADALEQLAHAAGFMKPGLDADWSKDQSESFLMRFNTMFRNQIRTLAQDPNVRGFKSVVCYRTGLDVCLDSRNIFRPHQSLTESPLLSSFHEFLQEAVRSHKYRVAKKEVNDYLVVAVCDVLDKLIDTDGESLPIQFHTGLGDVDIDLVKANPAYLKPLITAFPHVDFVLLHSSYPYTREAGYMATHLANAWLDIGLAFPMLSREGEETVLRQALELTPASKILWSTDGHLHPESYYLANRQFRAAFEKVLLAYVQARDMSVAQAINMAVDIMFWNSNQLYKLDEERKYPQLAKACGRSSGDSLRTLLNGGSQAGSYHSGGTTLGTSQPATAAPEQSAMSLPESALVASADNNVSVFDKFRERSPSVKYIWIQFVDYAGITRLRMIPIAAFRNHLVTGKYPGITKALPGLLMNDTLAEGTVATGEFKLVPDMASIYPNAVLQSPSATVHAWWMEDASSRPMEHFFACPRWALQKQINALKSDYGIDILMGFEIEITFMRPVLSADQSEYSDFQPINMIHSWSNLTYQDLDMLPIIEEIVEMLAEVGIHIDQFHCEAAPSQWEFPLPASTALQSIDTLYKARQIIGFVARKHGLKATLYPRPFNFSCCSASHAHFSINGSSGVVERYSDNFLAGILTNLTSILAFTLPMEESYARIVPGIWAGSEYVCWGTQNRETPLRQCGPGHWELKTVDGVGNMYLSMAAVIASGLYGVHNEIELTYKDNLVDAATLSAAQREDLGIKTLLPKTLKESLQNLHQNTTLRSMMGDGLVDKYIAMKRAEMQMLDAKSEQERRVYLISRY